MKKPSNKPNLIGSESGYLLVLRELDKKDFKHRKKNKAYWVCICRKCNNEVIVDTSTITVKKYKSCGCAKKEWALKRSKLNLLGKKFNYLTVIKSIMMYQTKHRKGRLGWLCKCDCGKETIVVSSSLLTNTTKSCGCLSYKSKWKKGQVGFTALKNIYKRNARNRKLKFELTDDEFRQLTSQNCYYCNEPPSMKSHTSNVSKNAIEYSQYIYNGIDRLNRKKGYNLKNCVPSCTKCNKAKNIADSRQFFNWVKKVYFNLLLKKEPIWTK